MLSIATVTTRVFATFAARIPLPKSICEMIQPPKMSPLGFVSAGIAIVRMTSSPFGLSAMAPTLAQSEPACPQAVMNCDDRMTGTSGTRSCRLQSQDQHAVAVAVKSVALADRLLVGAQNELPPGESTHQHEQRRARQVKICQEHIDMADSHRRMNENRRSPTLRHAPALMISRSRFQNRDGRVPNAHVLPAGLL